MHVKLICIICKQTLFFTINRCYNTIHSLFCDLYFTSDGCIYITSCCGCATIPSISLNAMFGLRKGRLSQRYQICPSQIKIIEVLGSLPPTHIHTQPPIHPIPPPHSQGLAMLENAWGFDSNYKCFKCHLIGKFVLVTNGSVTW